MRSLQLIKSPEYSEPIPFNQLSKISKTSTKDKNLMDLLSDYKDLTYKEADLIWEPKE
jgi:hypothetical protein